MSDDIISADEARELLEGSTPGPWCAGRSSSGHLCIAQMADPGEDVAVALDAIFADAALMAAAPDLARTVVALHARAVAAEAELQKARKEIAGLRRAAGHVRLSLDHGEDCDSVECVCGLEYLEDLAGPVVGRALTGFGSPTDCRETAGMSLYDAAVASCVSVERIEAIERGEPATGEEFARLVAAYCVPGWVRPEVTP